MACLILGCRIQDFEFKVQDSGFTIQGAGPTADNGAGFRVQGLSVFTVQGSRFGVRGAQCTVYSACFRIEGPGLAIDTVPWGGQSCVCYVAVYTEHIVHSCTQCSAW